MVSNADSKKNMPTERQVIERFFQCYRRRYLAYKELGLSMPDDDLKQYKHAVQAKRDLESKVTV